MENFGKILFLFLFLAISGCKNPEKQEKFNPGAGESIPVEYAEGFSIVKYDNFKIVTVKNPWPDSEVSYRYLLAEKGKKIPEDILYDQKIIIPVEEIVITSTTHISSLEILNEENALVGFPGLDYISSEKTRDLIAAGKVKDLGQNQALNTEILLALKPDVVVGFAVDGSNKALELVQKNGIPVVLNGDWMESSPLGKAEWIKFFGAFFNKLEEAGNFFDKIKRDYIKAKNRAQESKNRPTVLAGAMNQGTWYLPSGESWHAKFFEDANANYFFSETKGTGSLSLAFETVFSKAKNADFWIGPAEFQSYEQIKNTSEHYTQFKAFQNRNIYTYSSEKGPTGGVIFYELAPLRPDLVLKDLISIFHPDLLPEYERTFYKALK